MRQRLSLLRLALFLLCLLGAQHGALVHAFEHVRATAGTSFLDAGGSGGGGEHGLVCADCLSAQSFSAIFASLASAAVPSGLAHVCRARAAAHDAHCPVPEPRAHGPPASFLL
jgi:hypothetical protein